ncbi:hypothetical protein ES705_11157 [subsurface metagenome]
MKLDKKPISFDNEIPRSFVQKLTSNAGVIFLFGDDKKKKAMIKESLEKDKYIENIVEYNIECFPDFIVVLKDDYVLTKEPSFFLKRRTDVFFHTNRGFFMAFGKNMKKCRKELIEYQDIVPTIIILFGIKKPEYMKGKILDIL